MQSNSETGACRDAREHDFEHGFKVNIQIWKL